MAASLSMRSSFFKKIFPVRSANSQFAQVITEGDKASFPKITSYGRKFEMKYVVTVQAEKQVYLEVQVLVEFPDGIKVDEGIIQNLCFEPAMALAENGELNWEEIDSEWPSFSGIDSIEELDDPDEEADLRFIQAEDGSLVPADRAGDQSTDR
ncbi:hypothetical protein FYK55_27960 [Roseiconus nitratireducens]|uniref:Uncharacterized protein n=1 Tax=Roseiconus nitratireducens TaxID=2605748 RepID=A0A5M6CRY4_9BACT|nr:hypothetical protein [Roseiconus nitratireducens]KAA5537981.1 hypothetical protein FYK55_27960 [Roseiconus nitratireducens]